MTTYYLAPILTSGSGTIDDPFGVPDMMIAGPPDGPGIAFTILQSGDTLFCRGGDYHIVGTSVSGAGQIPICHPNASGTILSPITIQKYPGELPRFFLDSGAQPLFGTATNYQNNVRFLGLTVTVNALAPSGGFLTSPPAFAMGGTNCEIGYCEIIGCTTTSSDNHNGIFVQGEKLPLVSNGLLIHHNNIHDVIGPFGNSSGLTIYGGINCIVEDNWFHNNTTPCEDKDSGTTLGAHNTIWRRNYMQIINTTAPNQGWVGPVQNKQAALHIYDNWMEGSTNLDGFQDGSQYFNNLLTNIGGSSAHGKIAIGQGNANYFHGQIWNNVIDGGGANFSLYATSKQPLGTGLTAMFSYLDFNVYTAIPWYQFTDGTRNLATFRALGFEGATSVVPGLTTVYEDLVSYELQAPYQTSGRFGDPVGPRFPIATILDTTRYGPQDVTPPSPPVQRRLWTASNVRHTRIFS